MRICFSKCYVQKKRKICYSLKDKCTIIPADYLIKLIKYQPNSGVRCARLKWEYAVCCVAGMIFISFRHDVPLLKIWKKCISKQTFHGLFWWKIKGVPLKHNIIIWKHFFTPTFYAKESKLFSESSPFGDYNIYFVRQNRFSRFRAKHIFLLYFSPLYLPKKWNFKVEIGRILYSRRCQYTVPT